MALIPAEETPISRVFLEVSSACVSSSFGTAMPGILERWQCAESECFKVTDLNEAMAYIAKRAMRREFSGLVQSGKICGMLLQFQVCEVIEGFI